MSVDSLNRHFGNVEAVISNRKLATHATFPNLPSEVAVSLIEQVFSGLAKDLWADEALSNLRAALSSCWLDVAYGVTRPQSLAEQTERYLVDFKTSLIGLEGRYPDRFVGASTEATRELANQAALALVRNGEALVEELSRNSLGEQLLVFGLGISVSRRRPELEYLLDDSGLASAVHIYGKREDYVNNEIRRVLWFGPLARAAGKPELRPHLRRIFFSGLSRHILIYSPEAFARRSNSRALSGAFEGLDLARIPEIEEVGRIAEFRPEDRGVMDDIEFIENSAYQTELSDVESVSDGGDERCRLLELKDGFAIPVETGSRTIRVLSKGSADGAWGISTHNPFSADVVGLVAIASVDSGESGHVWGRAAELMGPEAAEFWRAQAEWKESLRSLIASKGELATISELRGLGALKPHRVASWIDPRLIAPLHDSDFQVLLRKLGVSEPAKTLALCKRFDSCLIAAGREAAAIMVEQITMEQSALLEAGEAVLVQLDQFGGARFFLSPVVAVGQDIVDVPMAQVRRLIRIAGKALP